jgi:hypothetical protein
MEPIANALVTKAALLRGGSTIVEADQRAFAFSRTHTRVGEFEFGLMFNFGEYLPLPGDPPDTLILTLEIEGRARDVATTISEDQVSVLDELTQDIHAGDILVSAQGGQ